MIHYINNKPTKHYRMNKAKRRAVPHYRHTKRMRSLATITASALLLAGFATLLIITMAITTN